jgi:anaerobic magnesium-protoporphyrin IX monomethyl ester cyclase
MRVLIVNPPHPSIGSRVANEHLPPLGLLSVGGSLMDAGHHVELLDADLGPLSVRCIAARAASFAPDAVLMGHSGSTSAHPMVANIAASLRDAIDRKSVV